MKKQKKVKIKQPAVEPKFHIIWSPQSEKPPRVRFSKVKAEEVADIMAKKYGTQFYVMSSVSLHQMGKPDRIPCTGKEQENFDAVKFVVNVSARQMGKTMNTPPPLANAGQAWSDDQDYRLRKLFNQGSAWSYIATAMGRSLLSIKYRLQHLGLVGSDAEEMDDDVRWRG